jgi:hypothetical protein
MPEEIEVPIEKLHESIQEEAEKAREKWVLFVALSTAILAVLAALSSLMAGHHVNEALIDQIQASDQWLIIRRRESNPQFLKARWRYFGP